MSFFTEEIEGQIWINYNGWTYTLPSRGIHRLKKSAAKKQASDGDLLSPMPGQVQKLNVKQGDSVTEGQTLCVVEAMKMEHSLKAPFNGKVENVSCSEGDSVSLGDLLLLVKKQ